MNLKKKIGISYTRTLFQNYWNWFTPADLGNDVELVELSFEKNNVAEIHQCDGFILTGGVDVDPRLYNGETHYDNRPDQHQLERDRFEELIFRYSQAQRLPLLGICRGMQLVNVLQGGKLIQDLDDGNERHRKEASDKEHTIITGRDTLLYRIAGSPTGHVNSAHHQAIDPGAIGENLLVNAYDDDAEKIIEGLEFRDKTNKGFMLCVQWHPERIPGKEENPFSENIKRQFLEAVRATGMNKLTVINPATEAIITAVNTDNRESLQAKFDYLQRGQGEWGRRNLGDRIQVLKQFATLLEQNMDQLANTLTAEVGKPLQQARNEVKGAMARIQWLTDNAGKYLANETMRSVQDMDEMIVYEPLGIVCNISAWNYPYLVGVNVFVPALLAGNAVMYKPSEYATLTGLEIEKLLKLAGVNSNAFQVALGSRETGELLLDMAFDGYFFTGSYKTGQHIYERVAHKMVPCQLELGGKDPLYVASDVSDVAAVAAATADGAFYNNGQSCCAVERIYVHEKIYDQYLSEFVKEVRSWKLGAPVQEGTYIGPLTRKDQLTVLEQQVSDALKKGAELATGGKRLKGKGYFFEPTVLVHVNHDMAVMKDESFGPIIGIMKVNSDEEAIRLMQDTEYGLTASVYSADQSRAQNILGKINAGTGYWNCCDRVSAALPWSGRKHSGFGVTLSHAGLRAFTRPKAYHWKQP
jgi:acyl-CoA reductase-like NAD-dependent aldehyde dehydrogenase/gamma-glutamyl-gamma-aminobutyrate hydrolase PuuD